MGTKVRVRKSGHQFFSAGCPHCNGSGTVPRTLDGWYIDYHYQDGHEQCGPYTKEEAVRLWWDHNDGRTNHTLIGPDGQVYLVEKVT